MKYPISRYLGVTRAYHPSLSYDGRLLVFISNTAGIPQIYEMPLTGDLSRPTWRDQITQGKERVLGCWFSPVLGDERLIFAKDQGGDENVQFDMLDREEGRGIHLTAGYEKARHIFGEWSADGSQIIFGANRRNPALFDLYVQPLGGAARMVWHNDKPGLLGSISFSPDAARAIVVRETSAYEHELFEIELDKDHSSQLTPSGESIRFVGARYSNDGKWIYINTDLDSDYLYIARLHLATLDFEPVISAEWDVENMTLSPDGNKLAYTVNVDGSSRLRVMDLASKETRTAPIPDDVPGVVAKWDAHLTFSPFSRHVAFSYTSAIRSADIYIWNLENDQLHAITRSSHGSVSKKTFRAPDLIRYPSFDGREIPAWFYKPAPVGDDPVPALLYIHGGPAAQHRPSFSPLIQYFISHGIAVFAPNVRGSAGYGKAYSQLDDLGRRMESLSDVVFAANWLKERQEIDGDRLAIYGENYGGFMVLAAMTAHPELWAAGVVMAGIFNFVSFLENMSPYYRSHFEAEYGSPTRDREFLESVSPIHKVDKIAAPLMLIHGANDPYVPVGETEQLVETLTAMGIPFEVLIFDDEGQEVAWRPNLRKAYGAIVDFLEAQLIG